LPPKPHESRADPVTRPASRLVNAPVPFFFVLLRSTQERVMVNGFARSDAAPE